MPKLSKKFNISPLFSARKAVIACAASLKLSFQVSNMEIPSSEKADFMIFTSLTYVSLMRFASLFEIPVDSSICFWNNLTRGTISLSNAAARPPRSAKCLKRSAVVQPAVLIASSASRRSFPSPFIPRALNILGTLPIANDNCVPAKLFPETTTFPFLRTIKRWFGTSAQKTSPL